jgi:hypothetical protein
LVFEIKNTNHFKICSIRGFYNYRNLPRCPALRKRLEGVGGFHLEGLYSIKSLNTKLNGSVKKSFAYVVFSDTYAKEEFLKREEDFKKIRKNSFPLPSKLLTQGVKLEKKKEPCMTR